MGKKCIPGIICVENMTLFVLIMILIVVFYLFYKQMPAQKEKTYVLVPTAGPSLISRPSALTTTAPIVSGVATRNDPLTNLHAPPEKDGMYFRRDSGDPRGIPINVQTRSVNTNYQQMGLLTRRSGELILPLMGRQLTTGNYKWQYYTMTTTGNMNTKLPISLNGKSCTSEYGCDSLSNGDVVYVEGYSDTFRVTLYENSTFNYIPFV
jgi:hypothetical protein